MFEWWKEVRGGVERELWAAQGYDAQWSETSEDGHVIAIGERKERNGGESISRGSALVDDEEFTITLEIHHTYTHRSGRKRTLHRHTLVDFEQIGQAKTQVAYTTNFVMSGDWRWWNFLPGEMGQRCALHQSGLRYIADLCEKDLLGGKANK